MPSTWTKQQERQYEHIRDGYVDRGVPRDEAKERAARTINADRDASGAARDGDGRPTKDELYAEAKRMGIDGRSGMDKAELRRAIAGHRGGTRTARG